MGKFLSVVLLPFILILSVAMPAHAEREGAAIFTPPAGWARITAAEGTRYESPDKTASLSFGRAVVISGTLAAPLDNALVNARKADQYKEEFRQQESTHASSGGVWTGAVYSYADASRNAYAYVWVVLVGAGGRAAPVTVTFANQQAYNAHGSAVAKVVNDMTLTSTVILESGATPLTRYAMDETTDFVEWMMQAPLTIGQRNTLETEVRSYWKTKNQEEIDGIVELLAARDQLAELKPAERDLARQAVLDEGIKQWRKDKKSPTAKMLVAIHDAAHKPIVKGNPPLTRQSVDAFAEFLFFAASQAAGVPDVTPTAAIKAKLAADVAKGYKKMAKDQRELIASMPLVWAALRAGWTDLPADEKAQYIEGWKSNAALVKLGSALDPSQVKVTATQGRLGSSTSAADVNADAMRNQMALQAQQQHFQMMQQIMRKNFETSLIMSSNLGGNTSYSYRW